MKKEGLIWKLKKPLYELNDSSRKLLLRVKEVFAEIGLKILEGDYAY